MVRLIFYLLLLVYVAGCGNNDEKTEEFDNDTTFNLSEKAEVKISVIHFADFSKEIISNGKLTAVQKADLQFRTSENIAGINFKNGDRINKGQLIAFLDNFTLRNTLNQSTEQFEKSRLDLTDLLIGQGYSIADTAKIPESIMNAAKIKCGYERAKNERELAIYNFKHSELRAPFNGILADLKLHENNLSVAGEKFCTLIDNTRFEAEFSVLENELSLIRRGQSVTIIPYALQNFEVNGQISQINPVIDKNGMVTVKAICVNKNNLLAEGMNVKVIVEEKVPKQLIIPKGALVLRSGKQVVFTMQNGLAKWNYVKTVLENSSSYTISEGLQDGDTVIVDGNLNLAHDSRVILINEEMKK